MFFYEVHIRLNKKKFDLVIKENKIIRVRVYLSLI
jgi:hypothetical protein